MTKGDQEGGKRVPPEKTEASHSSDGEGTEELTLRESEARYHALTEQAADAFCVLNEQSQIVEVNREACVTLGYTREELLKLRATDLVVGLSLEEEQAMYAGLKMGEPITLDQFQRRKDGSIFPVEVRVALVPVNGRRLFLRLARDLSHRVESQRALEEKNKQLRDILDSMFIFVGLFSTDGIIIEINQTPLEAVGIGREDAIGKVFWDTIWWAHSVPAQKRLQEAFRHVSEVGVVRRVEEVQIKDGGRMMVDMTLSPLRDASGKITQVVGSAADITDRILMERELRELGAALRTAREEEAIRISREIHDQMGQALTGLNMDVSALREAVKRHQHDESEAVDKRLQQMAGAIGGAMQTARRISSELRPAVLDELGLSAALEWQAREFEGRSSIFCNLALSPNEAPVMPRKQATAVFRIFQEVLTNVARHSQATEISISLSTLPAAVILVVQDNGVGMANPKEAHFRGHGLIGMQERALEAGVALEIESAEGAGTTVRILVPQQLEE